MKIVFLDAATVGDTSLAPIERLGDLVCWPTSTPEEARERVGDCDVLIVNKVKVDKGLLAAAPKLRLVCEAATGVNNIDLEACAQREIPVRNVAGYSTDSVVQETFMHILNLMGNGPYFDHAVKSGAYSRGGIFTDVGLNSDNYDGLNASEAGSINVSDLSITPGLDESWENILLLGIDGRVLTETSRSDTMMICSINTCSVQCQDIRPGRR